MLNPRPISAAIAGMPSAVAGTFTSRLGRAIRSCSRAAAAIVAVGVSRQLRRDFDRYEPVAAVRVVEGRTQHRQGVGNVVHRQFPIGILSHPTALRR